MKSIQKKIVLIIGKVPTTAWIVLLAALILPSYIYGWNTVTAIGFETTIYQITVVYLIFLYIAGMFLDKVTKKMPKKKGWLVYFAGLIFIIMFFKYVGGMETFF